MSCSSAHSGSCSGDFVEWRVCTLPREPWCVAPCNVRLRSEMSWDGLRAACCADVGCPCGGGALAQAPADRLHLGAAYPFSFGHMIRFCHNRPLQDLAHYKPKPQHLHPKVAGRTNCAHGSEHDHLGHAARRTALEQPPQRAGPPQLSPHRWQSALPAGPRRPPTPPRPSPHRSPKPPALSLPRPPSAGC